MSILRHLQEIDTMAERGERQHARSLLEAAVKIDGRVIEVLAARRYTLPYAFDCLPAGEKEIARKRAEEIAALRGERMRRREYATQRKSIVKRINVHGFRIKKEVVHDWSGYYVLINGTMYSLQCDIRNAIRSRVKDILGRRIVYRSPRVKAQRDFDVLRVSVFRRGIQAVSFVVPWVGNARGRRKAIAEVLRQRRAEEVLNGTQYKHLGFRFWDWDQDKKVLVSPYMKTPWPTAQLKSTSFDSSWVTERKAGIHAYRLTKASWKQWKSHEHYMPPPRKPYKRIVGIIEIGGKYVLGTSGLRCEVATIKELATDDPQVALHLTIRYPGVKVHLIDPRPRV